ncbi:hypothetical protein K504DRAFT_487908 [Pleomassaria siparia CBS 279.74]|uniref:Uncharacterized protein n=1 Tax=Pleomassaria siparia CBS 279.74 TaxID=1314801 RepID=A0A6G1KLU1_9PLEO|nr:hypothetical protein K504DRAFT_487908 [Pleomassaria siparia CBS 279.74]
MSSRSTGRDKGKTRMPSDQETVNIDAALSSLGEPVHLPLPVSPPRNVQLPSAIPSSSAGSSSTPLPISSQGVKRKQSTITSFFLSKKDTFETILTVERKKAASNTRKAGERAIKASKAVEMDRRVKGERREEAGSAKTARAEEERLKQEDIKAEGDAIKKERVGVRMPKEDWIDWVNSHQQRDSNFEMPEKYDPAEYPNETESEGEFGINLNEQRCLAHCEKPNPADDEHEPIKLFRRSDVQQLAWRKAAVLNGVHISPTGRMLSTDEGTLLRIGRILYEQQRFGDSSLSLEIPQHMQ